MLLLLTGMMLFSGCKKDKEDGPDQRVRIWAERVGYVEMKTTVNGAIAQNWNYLSTTRKETLEKGDVYKLYIKSNQSSPIPYVLLHYNIGPDGDGQVIGQLVAYQPQQTYEFEFTAP